MNKSLRFCLLTAWVCAGSVLHSAAAQPTRIIELWPGAAPGDGAFKEVEADTTKPGDHLVAGKPVIRLGNVSRPTLALYPASGSAIQKPAVLVCPGGAYRILAMDLEGTEICEWLNSIGVTGILLKYRVPSRSGTEKHTAALQDAQRALSLARYHGREWGVDPARLGVMGFSAGGHLAALVGNDGGRRSYPPGDAADQTSWRPDFTLLVYPAYLTVKEKGDSLAPEFQLSSNTPPTFIAMAEDDPVRVETALYYSLALRKAAVPFELHIFPSGGHGYGLRPGADLVTTWPQRAAEFLRSRHVLESR